MASVVAAITPVILALLAGSSAAYAASEVVSNCSDDTELRADLAAVQSGDGGTLTFACGPSTIVLTADLPEIATETTVDGGDEITISGANARRIFRVSSGATLTLRHIVLTNGSASGDGGAIFSFGGLVLQSMTIRDSVAALSGGAFVAYGPTVVKDSELAFNEAKGGGAVYARFNGAPVIIERSWIHDNDGGPTGGAVFLWDGADVTIRDSELSGNRATSGGAIYNGFSNSSVTVERSRLHDNTAGGPGGAIGMNAGPLVVTDSEIYDNSTDTGGGGLAYQFGSSADIRQTTFRGNVALGAGGAVLVDQSSGVGLTNVTLSGNDAYTGGAMFAQASSGAINHVTIAANTAGDVAGGLYLGSGSFLIANSLLSGNSPSNCVIQGTLSSFDGNVSSDQSCASQLNKPHDENGASTMLGPLAMNGGLTSTHLPGPDSDAIDAAVLQMAFQRDQRGVTRPQGAAADAGAVEVASCPQVVICGDSNRNGSLSATDALRALQFSVGSAQTCPLWLCDFNGNGAVTATDALGILRSAVGLPSSPNCPAAWDCHSLG